MNEIIYTCLKCLVAVCAALVSAYVIPYIRRLSQKEEYQRIVEMIETAVYAAEQTIKGDGKGKEKKEIVVQYACEWLNQHGISLTEEQLDALIECAVFNLNTETYVVREGE